MSRGDRARRLRRRSTFAEDRIWDALRDGRVDGWKFRRDHPVDRYFADFACVRLRLIIEVDGAVHELEGAELRDAERTAVLEALGWTVMRFNNDVAVARTTEIIEAVRRHAEEQRGRG